MRKHVLVAMLALGAVACGGSETTFNGTIRGVTFQPVSALSAIVTLGTTNTFAFIGMGERASSCNQTETAQAHPNDKSLTIVLLTYNPSGMTTTAPTGPGTFTVFNETVTTAASAADVEFKQTDSACKDVESSKAKAVSGTVTLTQADGSRFVGTGDVVADSGDHWTFTFNAPTCVLTATDMNPSSLPECG